jgi:hypothetical protein
LEEGECGFKYQSKNIMGCYDFSQLGLDLVEIFFMLGFLLTPDPSPVRRGEKSFSLGEGFRMRIFDGVKL